MTLKIDRQMMFRKGEVVEIPFGSSDRRSLNKGPMFLSLFRLTPERLRSLNKLSFSNSSGASESSSLLINNCFQKLKKSWNGIIQTFFGMIF